MGRNIKFKSYVYRQHIYTVRYGNGSATIPPLVVFIPRNFVAEFIRFKLIFIQKMTTLVFEPPFGRLWGNICTSSIAHWKARSPLLIRDVELFSLALTVETF